MAEYSAHYNWIMLGAGEQLSKDDYAFTRRNISSMDSKAYLGAEGHKHDGSPIAVADPSAPLSATLVPSSGGIPGGRTVRYKYTWVDQYGQETAASPEVTVNTPAPVVQPNAPSITKSTGGTLLPGNYFYVVTAWRGANTLETTPSSRTYTTLNYGSGMNEITVHFPSLPSTATGFNVYRRSPGSTRFQFIYSADLSVATPPTEWVDTGAVAEDCNRTVPTKNTTATSNSILLSIPGATPTVPSGYTWKVYRTYTSGDWDSSLLHWTVEETSFGSGVITPSYSDVGQATTAGKYPASTEMSASPSKINLENMGEVQGVLPVGANVIPTTITFTYAGTLVPQSGDFIWVNEYDLAQIISVRCHLGKGSVPASTDVIANVKKYDSHAATPTWTSIFASSGDRPIVPVGNTIGSKVTLTTPDTQILLEGDALVVDIDQAGGGATPTDSNLVVTIVLYVSDGSSTVSHNWATD